MENIDFASNGIVEVKNDAGEIQEIRFKIRFLSLIGKVVKNIFLSILIFIAIIFSLFTFYSIPFFLFIILLAVNKRTIVVTKENFITKNSIPIFPTKKISILELQRLEVKRVENKNPNRSSSMSVTFELYAIFKNKPSKMIFRTMNPILADQMDRKIEKMLNIKDISNNDQFEKIIKTGDQNNLEAEYSKTTHQKFSQGSNPPNSQTSSKNLNIDQPSTTFPFTISTNLINLKIVHFYNYSTNTGGISLLVGLVFTAIGIFIPLFNSQANPLLIVCAIIGIPVLSFGISNVFNKRFITVSKSKINYYTKPISIRKQKEILKSQINSLEVRFSGHRVNNVPIYNIVIETKSGKTHKLIKHVYNEMALKDLANEINHHMSLKT
ncbi:hypothetical protein N9X23_02160 [Flavobacteriales bacterium]|nr:hypothetical protein [Flavobacteriales bacterium]